MKQIRKCFNHFFDPMILLIYIFSLSSSAQKIISLIRANVDAKVVNPHQAANLAKTAAENVRALLQAKVNPRKRTKKKNEKVVSMAGNQEEPDPEPLGKRMKTPAQIKKEKNKQKEVIEEVEMEYD